MTHTKGPWIVDESTNGVYRITNSDNEEIARSPRSGIAGQRTYSNAKVLASAPDLLEALEQIRIHQGKVCEEYDLCSHIACKSSYSAWVIADKAIQKARGQ